MIESKDDFEEAMFEARKLAAYKGEALMQHVIDLPNALIKLYAKRWEERRLDMAFDKAFHDLPLGCQVIYDSHPPQGDKDIVLSDYMAIRKPTQQYRRRLAKMLDDINDISERNGYWFLIRCKGFTIKEDVEDFPTTRATDLAMKRLTPYVAENGCLRWPDCHGSC